MACQEDKNIIFLFFDELIQKLHVVYTFQMMRECKTKFVIT